MKFFFADNVDAVDPDYNFIADISSPSRNRQLCDIYAHEALKSPPYDGILVSCSSIGLSKKGSRYTFGQRLRAQQQGMREFLRFPQSKYSGDLLKYPIMGDCGSFSYINLKKPPHSADEMVEFYEMFGFTHGVSPDHIIAGYSLEWDNWRRRPSNISERAEYTDKSAKEFINLCRIRKSSFIPIGAVQSWSPSSAVQYARKLVSYGYEYIGLGGLAARPTQEIYNLVSEVKSKIPKHIKVHLFGFNRFSCIDKFVGLGVSSFDSTSPLIKAFKDEKYNYFSPGKGGHYLAIRIPPLHEVKLKKRIQSGVLDHDAAASLEEKCLKSIRDYAKRKASLNAALSSVCEYESYVSPGADNREAYRRTLYDRPWEKCGCKICRNIGIEVIIFRGINRNKRRGFHNLYIFFNKLNEVKSMKIIKAPCIKVAQGEKKTIFSFVVNGKDIPKFASVSRISRSNKGKLAGYQRPEIAEHIRDIKTYLEKSDSMLPNSIVIAFNRKLKLDNEQSAGGQVSTGLLEIPIEGNKKAGWIVDGQQRAAAIRSLSCKSFPVSIVAFESKSVDEEREQFLLVNNTRPLPKSVVYELLPSIGNSVPAKLKKRQKACRILEKLNLDEGSPFYFRIKTATSAHAESANIKDMSVLKMIENSMENGALSKSQNNIGRTLKILDNYWAAVKSFYDKAWELPPRKSRLTHGVGIVSMGYIMDAAAYKLFDKWQVPPMNAFLSELKILGKQIPWSEGEWRFSNSMIVPWDELQNTSRHIDLVANFLIRLYKSRSKRI